VARMVQKTKRGLQVRRRPDSAIPSAGFERARLRVKFALSTSPIVRRTFQLAACLILVAILYCDESARGERTENVIAGTWGHP
jgi:hypothetical protein